jgi:hypothetical protein
MARIFIIAGVLCICGSLPAYAQSVITPSVLNYGTSLVCTQDSPGRGIVPLPISSTARLVWCQESNAPDIGYHLIVTVLGADRVARELYNQPLVAGGCGSAPPMWECSASFPVDAVASINAQPPGSIIGVRIAAPLDIAPDLTNPEELLRSTNLVRMLEPTLGCSYTPPSTGVAETRPINDAIGGVMTGTWMEIATRVGQLRRDGWRVEWAPNPLFTPTPTQSMQIGALFWCVGVPQ